jgi:translation initiation factor 5B
MAPKKKNNKKNDDWESELGETAPAAAVETPETQDEPAEADAEEEFPAGGLMAMMRKNKKKKKGKQTEDFVEGEDPPAEEEPESLADKAPVEASIDDEFALPDKKSKGKPTPAKPVNTEEEEDEERGADGKIMTKAQKEKAKKEREKQRKKENAAKKKTPAAPAAKAAEVKPIAETKVEETPTSQPAAGGKGKKLPPALAKLQRQQEEIRKREEEKARAIAEEKARLEEIEQQEAEEEQRKKEEREKKKQREKEKIEQQKKDGTYLTKAQREEKLRNEMKLKQMIASGVKVGGLEGGEKKKVVYDNKRKKGGKKNPEEIKVYCHDNIRRSKSNCS